MGRHKCNITRADSGISAKTLASRKLTSMTRSTGVWALVFVVVLLCKPSSFANTAAAAAWSPLRLTLPPVVRLAVPRGEDALRRDCEAHRAPSSETADLCLWERDATNGLEVAAALFRSIARSVVPTAPAPEESCPTISTTTTTVWLPSAGEDVSTAVSDLCDVVNRNSARLGNVTASARFWPKAPATGIALTREETFPLRPAAPVPMESGVDVDGAVRATKLWVDGTLGRMGLCPFTRSMSRAAVGLEGESVSEGPVVVHHACGVIGPSRPRGSDGFVPVPDAALLASAFWEGVLGLANLKESEVSTLLIVAPPSYDDDFVEFVGTCDELLEMASRAAGADEVIGKAWFHPRYETSTVGHSTVLPGHALPPDMVEGFVDRYFREGGVGVGGQRPCRSSISQANDEVRHTPHATVNLLRRTQLRAAKAAEAKSPVKRPNAVYARNVLRIISEWRKGSTNKFGR